MTWILLGFTIVCALLVKDVVFYTLYYCYIKYKVNKIMDNLSSTMVNNLEELKQSYSFDDNEEIKSDNKRTLN